MAVLKCISIQQLVGFTCDRFMKSMVVAAIQQCIFTCQLEYEVAIARSMVTIEFIFFFFLFYTEFTINSHFIFHFVCICYVYQLIGNGVDTYQ